MQYLKLKIILGEKDKSEIESGICRSLLEIRYIRICRRVCLKNGKTVAIFLSYDVVAMEPKMPGFCFRAAVTYA